MTPVVFKARVRLFPSEYEGRKSPIRSDYRPSWNLGNTWLGTPTLNDGWVLLEGALELAPGSECPARIEPLSPEFWGRVRPGSVLPMQEGPHVVGCATIVEIADRPTWFIPEVTGFVDQARQYCDFIENAGTFLISGRVVRARRALLGLYAAGSELPQVEPPEGFEAGPSLDTPKGWPGFGDFEAYWKVFDPYKQEEPVAGSLSDDLLDVYRDVWRGVALWDGDAPRTAAIWEWKFHFDTHWGDHAVDALRALHRAQGRTEPVGPTPSFAEKKP